MESARKLSGPHRARTGDPAAAGNRCQAGARPPYAIDVAARTDPGGRGLKLILRNTGTAGVWLNAHADEPRLGPWSYTVEAGKDLGVSVPAAAGDVYGLTLMGPNGFLRVYRGDLRESAVEVDARLEPASRRIVLLLHNPGESSAALTVAANAYAAEAARHYTLTPGQTREDAWSS